MLTYFPVRYKDELLYSIIARYHVHSGIPSYKTTIRTLFGGTSMRAVIDFPCDLDALAGNLPFDELTSDSFINENTLFPLFQPFLTLEKERAIKAKLKQGKNHSIHTQIGISASRIPSKRYLVFCPNCYQEEKQKYGEPYWHRIHQVPGVLVCPQHNCLLINSTVKLPLSNQTEYIAPFYEGNENQNVVTSIDKSLQEILFHIATDLYWIINSGINPKPLDYYREKYITKLKEDNLATFNGRVKQKQLNQAFQSFYSPELLNILNCNISNDSETNWIQQIVRKNRNSFHPLHHALMMRYLFGSVEAFFNSNIVYEPFGKGPWLCLNPAADHYMSRCIKEFSLDTNPKSNKSYGTFRCTCGYIYTRNLEERDEGKKTRVIEFGPIWQKSLAKLQNEGKSLTSMSDIMKADKKTIKRYISVKEESLQIDSLDEQKGTIIDKQSMVKIKRDKWLQLQKEYPGHSISKLRAISLDLYSWLYRNDKEWLRINSPNYKSSTRNRYHVDWDKRDKELLVELKKVIDSWNDKEKPIRKTISSISGKANQKVWITKYAEKLPMSISYLKSVVESIEEFQIRRVKLVVERLSTENLFIKEWMVYREAGLRCNISNKVKLVIADEIERNTNYSIRNTF